MTSTNTTTAGRKPAPRPRQLLVADLMTANVITMRPASDLEEVYERMAEEHIRHVPIVDREGDLVGLVTERDLTRLALGSQLEMPLSFQQDLLHGRKVREIMSTDVDTAEPDQSLKEAAVQLLENKVGCLPVVEGRHVVGILTEADFVRHFVEAS
jgi:CBS domain-containing protein